MIYRKYGQTGIEVSAIGFGGMRFEKPSDIDNSAALVKAAYDKGINYFDTAPMYCDDKSQEIFGAALKEMKKTRAQRPFYVSTKSMATTPSDLRKHLETSLKKTGLDSIDFYHYWCILSLDEHEKRKANGILKEFEKFKKEGMVKHIVVSTHLTGGDIDKLVADYPFEGILLGYSVMNFAYREKGIEAAAKRNMGVVVMNPLGGGLIPSQPQRFEFVKTQPKETETEGALRFLLNDPRITVLLVGMGNQKHLEDSIKAVDGFKPIDNSQIDRIRKELKGSLNELCTGCQYCDDCPVGIDVPKVMQAYNVYKLYPDNKNKRLELINTLRYGWGIDIESDYLARCTHCGNCISLCTQKLDITNRISEIIQEIEIFLKQDAKK